MLYGAERERSAQGVCVCGGGGGGGGDCTLVHVHVLESYKHTLHVSSMCACTCMRFDTPLP